MIIEHWWTYFDTRTDALVGGDTLFQYHFFHTSLKHAYLEPNPGQGVSSFIEKQNKLFFCTAGSSCSRCVRRNLDPIWMFLQLIIYLFAVTIPRTVSDTKFWTRSHDLRMPRGTERRLPCPPGHGVDLPPS